MKHACGIYHKVKGSQVNYKQLRADGKIELTREYTHTPGHKARAKRKRQNRKAGRR